jgi:hypothetical protein
LSLFFIDFLLLVVYSASIRILAVFVLTILLREAAAKNEWKKNEIRRFSERKKGVPDYCGNPGKIKRCFVLASCAPIKTMRIC